MPQTAACRAIQDDHAPPRARTGRGARAASDCPLQAGLPRRRARGGGTWGARSCLARGISSDGMAGIEIHEVLETETCLNCIEESRRRRAVAVHAMMRVVVLDLAVVWRKLKVGFKIDGEPLKGSAGREYTT
ncbi:hypothetical protein B0H17DRAFT_1150946 [Mycena rosella]|uniref:Uncharacterized protein n=1 Tax=Mycena rosella TaxID=1033263 RepID=A0AAD7BP01_MYCRO|nr:hypothetical protein B0H17DRAFT_1150946 [Mycena rosella]